MLILSSASLEASSMKDLIAAFAWARPLKFAMQPVKMPRLKQVLSPTSQTPETSFLKTMESDVRSRPPSSTSNCLSTVTNAKRLNRRAEFGLKRLKEVTRLKLPPSLSKLGKTMSTHST